MKEAVTPKAAGPGTLARMARAGGRAGRLSIDLMRGSRRFPAEHAGEGGSGTRAKAVWLQGICRDLHHTFQIECDIHGTVPERGLVVSNHLSYLDIVVLGALAPTVFVSKSDVAGWPVFGWFARKSGTIFVHRESRSDVVRAGTEVRAALDADRLLVLFPEGTSSGGESVLPFRSSLFEPVTGGGWPITAAALTYSLEDGDPSEDVCYWKDMTLVPHLLKLLTRRRIVAHIAYAPFEGRSTDRKELAKRLHEGVSRLHQVTREASRARHPGRH
jgi:1-acyl-sn-glycerol-3-phosphate acyltransferase